MVKRKRIENNKIEGKDVKRQRSSHDLIKNRFSKGEQLDKLKKYIPSLESYSKYIRLLPQ